MLTPTPRLRAFIAAAGLVLLTASTVAAAPMGPVSGGGGVSTSGGLEPIGDGRFRVSGREYTARLSGDDQSGCFRGQTQVSEDAVLAVPHYSGAHEGTIVIHSDSGTVYLRYRGSVDRYAGKGDWWFLRGTGACQVSFASGTYTSSLRGGLDPEFRLELRGRVGGD